MTDRAGRGVILIVAWTIAASGAAHARWSASSDDDPRDDQPVLVAGSALGAFKGMAVGDLAAFRWNPASGGFDPVPFQLDQRVAHVFNPGTQLEFTQTMYDVFGEDDGLLDDNDEMAFLFLDAGPRAPGDSAWVAGAVGSRVEIQVTSALPGHTPVTRWVYVFAGTGLPRSPTSYVAWDGREDTDVTTPVFTMGYEGKWILSGLRIAPPCGSGDDLIDRLKGRAVTQLGNHEDEENWNANSTYLGGLVGPVRAIRYVRGAQSAVNTVFDDVIYRRFWRRDVALRVHPLASASLYVDWLPIPGARYFSPTSLAGVPVDGVPDNVPNTFVSWKLTSTPGGGLAVVHDVAPSPLYQSRVAIYRDDASYDDRIPEDPGYGDDDDSAYGDSGMQINGISETGAQAIAMTIVAYPLCANVGDGSLGTSFRQTYDTPFQLVAVEQEQGLGAIRTLALGHDPSDLLLSWQAVAGATSYDVYASQDPTLPPASWTFVGQTQALSWRAVGALSGASSYYSVVAVGPGGEGDW